MGMCPRQIPDPLPCQLRYHCPYCSHLSPILEFPIQKSVVLVPSSGILSLVLGLVSVAVASLGGRMWRRGATLEEMPLNLHFRPGQYVQLGVY